jgi:hypothetical protein
MDVTAGPSTGVDSDPRLPAAFWRSCTLAVVVRPWLWHVALRAACRTSPRNWYRRPPFVPRPDPALLRFRFETAYGTTGAPSVADFLAYLDWCRHQ